MNNEKNVFDWNVSQLYTASLNPGRSMASPKTLNEKRLTIAKRHDSYLPSFGYPIKPSPNSKYPCPNLFDFETFPFSNDPRRSVSNSCCSSRRPSMRK